MKDREDNEQIDDDSIQHTTDDIQKRYSKESIENISSFSRSEETITLNSSLSNIEDTQFNSEEKLNTSKKYRNISDFLNNRIKKNLSETKKDNVESDSKKIEFKSKENQKLFMKQQGSSETTLPKNIYFSNNLSKKHLISLSDNDSIINSGSILNTTIEEKESCKQTYNSENLTIKQAKEQNPNPDEQETTDSRKPLSNEITTKLTKDSNFIKTNIEGSTDISGVYIKNNEIIETNENRSTNSLPPQNTQSNEIKNNLPTNNKISQLFTKSDSKFSLEDLLQPKPEIIKQDITKSSESTKELIQSSKQTNLLTKNQQIKDELQNLKVTELINSETKLGESKNEIIENNSQVKLLVKHEQIENELQNLKISGPETEEEVKTTEQKATSIYDLLNSKRTSTGNSDDPFAFLKKPLMKDSNLQETKTHKIEDINTELKQPIEFIRNNETSKNFTIIDSQNNIKQPQMEKINQQNSILKKDYLPKSLYKIKKLNSDLSIKEYNKNINKTIATETIINYEKTEQISSKNLLRNNFDNKVIKKIPSQVHLQKSIDTNSIIFGQSLKSYYSNIPHNCQLIKFTDKYFKTNDYTEGSPENYLKLLYSNKLNLKSSLKKILLKNNEINSTFLNPECSLLTAKLFIELITALNKTGDIEDLEIFEEFVCKNIQAEFQFSFKLFYNCLLGNLTQTPSKKHLNINFEDFLNLTVTLMDLLKKDSKLLSFYALQTTKEIEHSLSTYVPFLLFMFYKKYDINIFSFFCEPLLKEELYTSILLYEEIQLHSKSCTDNFLFSFVETLKLSSILESEILVGKVHKECEKCLEEFLKWKYTLLGKNEEFQKLREKSNVLSSILKSVSSAIIGVAEEKVDEAKFEIVATPIVSESVGDSNINSTCIGTNNSTFIDSKKCFSKDSNTKFSEDTKKGANTDKDTNKESEETKKEELEEINKELKEKKPVETKGLFSSLSTLIFGKPSETPKKKEDSKSLFNFLSSPKTNQTFKIKPQDTKYVYEKGEWVSTRKIDKKKKHEEYMKKLEKERSEKVTTLPVKPIESTKEETKKAEAVGQSSVELKYPQKMTKFLTPTKKINIPQLKRLKPLIKARNDEDEFFNSPLKNTELKTEVTEDFQISLEKGTTENLKTKNVKTESVNDFDKI